MKIYTTSLLLFFCLFIMSCENANLTQVKKNENPQVNISMDDYKAEMSLTIPFKIDSTYKLQFTNFKKLNYNNATIVKLIKNDSVINEYVLKNTHALKNHNKSLILENDFKKIVQLHPYKIGEIGVIRFIAQNGYEVKILVGRVENTLINLKFLPNQGIGYGKQKGENYTFKHDITISNDIITISKKQFLAKNDSLLKSDKKEYELHYNQLVLKEYFPKVDTLVSYQFKNDSNYSYHIINKRKNRMSDDFYSILKKEKKTIDSNTLRNSEYDYTVYKSGGRIISNYTDVAIDGVDELGVYTDEGTGEIWDGYGYNNILFGKTDSNKLIKEVYTKSEGGNGDSDFSFSYTKDEKFTIPTSKNELDGYLIINKFSFDEFYNKEDHQKKSEVHYYDFKEKYKLENDRFIMVYESYEMYVDSKTGLIVRPQPNFNERLGKLNYAEKITVISKSEILYTLNEGNGKQRKGYWCQILYPKAEDSIGYVFDAYLSKTKPKK